MLEETEARVRKETRATIVQQIRKLHEQLKAGNAAPMGYDWLASTLENASD